MHSAVEYMQPADRCFRCCVLYASAYRILVSDAADGHTVSGEKKGQWQYTHKELTHEDTAAANYNEQADMEEQKF